MKRISTILLMSIGPLFFAQSEEWKFIGSANNEKEFYYKPNTDETAWIKIVSQQTKYTLANKNSPVTKIVDGYNLTLFKFDCGERKIGVVQVNTYSKDGKLVNNSSIPEHLIELDYVVPETNGEVFLQNFCNK